MADPVLAVLAALGDAPPLGMIAGLHPSRSVAVDASPPARPLYVSFCTLLL